MILISGAAGNIGRRVARLLSRKHVSARVLARRPEKLAVENLELATGHLDDHKALLAACKGCDTLLLISRVDPAMTRIQKEACDVAVDAGVRRIVKLSGLDADPHAAVTLARWHGEIEKHIEALGVTWTHLRPNAFMQNVLLGAKSIASKLAFPSYAPSGKVSQIDADDIAEVACQVLTSDHHDRTALELTGPGALSDADIAGAIGALVGQKIAIEPLTGDRRIDSLKHAGLPQWWAELLDELYASYDRGEAARVTADVEKVISRPARSYSDFLLAHRRAFVAD